MSMQLQQSYIFLLLHMLGADMLYVQLTHSPSQIVSENTLTEFKSNC